MSRILSCLLFFVISNFTVHAQSAALFQESGAGVHIFFSRFQDSHVLPQPGESIGYGLNLRIAGRAGIHIAGGMEAVQVSSVKDGYFYRGYVSLGTDLGFFLYFPRQDGDSAFGGKPYFGIGVRGGFAYNKYAFLEQYFILLNAGIEPQIRFPLAAASPAGELGLGFPAVWYFRTDLDIHFSIGLRVYFSLPVALPQGRSD